MSYEPPTLEGRVLVDLGQQLTAMRARAEQAERERDHWQTRYADLMKDCQRYRTDLDLHRAAQDAAFAVFERLDDDGGTMAELAGRAIDRAEQAEADNARLRAALEAAKDFIVSFGQQTCLTEDRLFKKIDAALSHTPPTVPPCDDPDDGLHPADHVEDRGQRATKKRGTPEGLCTACGTDYCDEHVPVGTLDPDVCRVLGHGTVVCQDCGTAWQKRATA